MISNDVNGGKVDIVHMHRFIDIKYNVHAVVNGDCAVLLEHRFDIPRRQKCGI